MSKRSSKFKSFLGKIAPTLGLALGGPLGGMAGKFLADGLGVEEAQLESVVMNASPEQLAEIKRIEADFETQMKKLDIDLEALHAADRQDARRLASTTNFYPQIALSILLFCLYGWAIYLESHIDHDIPDLLLGVLTAGIPMMLQFWFGSSTGSKDKTSALAQRKENTL